MWPRQPPTPLTHFVVLQVSAWLLNLASVGVVCYGLSITGVKSERVVFVHVCVGISLQILMGVQVLPPRANNQHPCHVLALSPVLRFV